MTLKTCRSCDGADLRLILSLGMTPLANALRTKDDLEKPEAAYLLDLVFCPKCTLVQITETVPPETLFSEYLYFSSFSETVLENARVIAERMVVERRLDAKSFVVEIASNDGYLLKNYRAAGIEVLGVEPAQNIAKVAEENGIPTVAKFFNKALGEELAKTHGSADIIHANNVVAHVADLHGVVSGIAALLKPNGVAIIENHYVKDLIDHTEFDSIYHEHLCYYSATSFERLFARHGLKLVRVERIPIHGGSLRVFFQRADGPRDFSDDANKNGMLAEEKTWGVNNFEFYKNFGEKIERLRKELVSLLTKLRAEGSRVSVYGA